MDQRDIGEPVEGEPADAEGPNGQNRGSDESRNGVAKGEGQTGVFRFGRAVLGIDGGHES